MPIARAGSRLLYFAHVPKCGGTAVANHLAARFGPLAFEDRQFLNPADGARWTRSSPQHVDAESLDRLFPTGFFDAVFAVVRHPVERAISAYHFQSDVQQTIAPEVDFSGWLEGLPDQLQAGACYNDNHHRPMVDFVPEGAVVFRIEDGLDKVETWLTAEFGPCEGVAGVGPANVRSRMTRFPRTQRPRTVPNEADILRIGQIYAADYARFGYHIDTEDEAQRAGSQ